MAQRLVGLSERALAAFGCNGLQEQTIATLAREHCDTHCGGLAFCTVDEAAALPAVQMAKTGSAFAIRAVRPRRRTGACASDR